MGRPRRPVTKSCQIHIRCEPGEKVTIKQNARQAGMHCSGFMLHRSQFIPIKPKYDDQMIHRLDRAAGLVKKIGLLLVSRNERGRFWAVLDYMKKTVEAINAVVTRELDLPRVIGTELRNLTQAADDLDKTLIRMNSPDSTERTAALIVARERSAAIRGAAKMISVAYQRELSKITAEEQVDPILDGLLEYVVIAAGVKQEILAAHAAGQSPRHIAYSLKTAKGITLPFSAIDLLVHTANGVAQPW
ncbi:MAG TPA: hypothetical protein VD837_17675 [Terriglobales bacterium]|nr:hypothetical protein [Terriglobales bacterium]